MGRVRPFPQILTTDSHGGPRHNSITGVHLPIPKSIFDFSTQKDSHSERNSARSSHELSWKHRSLLPPFLYILQTSSLSFLTMMKPSDMVNLTRSSKNKNNNVVGRFKHDASCKKHPKHHQSPGVCSLCLRERLSQLSSSSTSRAAPSSASSSSVSSLSSYYSSSCGSSCASPSEPKTTGFSTSIFTFNSKHGLFKSRSVAASSRRRGSVGDDDTNGKSRGFLFNLLRPRHKKTEHKNHTHQLVRCPSVRQNVTVAG